MSKPLAERFWPKVEKTDGCWWWVAAYTNPRGYGVIVDHGRNRQAHRVSYELTYGPIPEGLYVCHTCDNRLCVRPTHLFVGSHRDNQLDKIAKGRSVREAHHSAKLTWLQVVEIRRRRAAGESQRALARAFGVSKQNIKNIMSGRSWATAPGEFPGMAGTTATPPSRS